MKGVDEQEMRVRRFAVEMPFANEIKQRSPPSEIKGIDCSMMMKGIKGDLRLILKFKDCHRGNCEVISPSGSALVTNAIRLDES
jgi:hypothetical protein